MFKDTGGWLRGRWPYRPKPKPDECLGSYVTRLALGLGVTPVRLVSLIWGSQRPLLYQDLDNHAPPHVVARICEGADLDGHQVAAMTFAAFEGRLFPNHWPNARKTWILPISIASNARRRAGLQFCPACLGEETPYLRRTWRLAFAISCTRHGLALRDRCPTCSAILHPFLAPSIRRCFRCGSDLCQWPYEAADDEALKMQQTCVRALEDGWSEFGEKPIHSISFFITMRRLAALAAVGRQSQRIRDSIASRYEGDTSEFERENTRHPIEYLCISERSRMYKFARAMAANWPSGFVEICREAGVTRSVVVKDMAYVPFILDEALKAHLDDEPYHASEGEVAAAAAWLRRYKGIATYRDLSAHCGESRKAIYRHMDYERIPKTPSVWRRSSRPRTACAPDATRAQVREPRSPPPP